MSRDEGPPLPRWETLASETIADCRVFAVERRRERREGPGLETADFYVLRAGDWVNVVALTEFDELVLIRQWRHAAKRVTLEIPGGMVDEGETPLGAAMRDVRAGTAPSRSFPSSASLRCDSRLVHPAELTWCP